MKDKGITLIALVITIIVLLILAGISIAMLTGENGILNKATTAKENTVAADEKEKVSLAYNDVLADKLDGTSSGDITVAEMESALEKQGIDNTKASVEKINGEDKIKITFIDTNNEYEVNTKVAAVTTSTAPTPSEDYLALREGDKVVYTYNGTQIPCTVLYDSTNENYATYGVQIIADDIVGEGVELGNGTRINMQLTDATYFAVAKDSYNDAIGILNRKAEDYLNKDLAKDARCVGSVPNDKNFKNTNKYSRSDSWFVYANQLEEGEEVKIYDREEVEGNPNYIADKEQMDSLGITRINGKEYWLASRFLFQYSNGSGFYIRTIKNDGTLDLGRLFDIGDTTYSMSETKSFRPVFTLKPDIKIEVRADETKLIVKDE